MKKLIMAILIAVSMVQNISAQDNNRQRMTPQQRTEQRIQKLDEKLSLTDNQKSQIRNLYADFYKQKYPKEKRKEAMEKLITDIAAVLTSNQQNKLNRGTNQVVPQGKIRLSGNIMG